MLFARHSYSCGWLLIISAFSSSFSFLQRRPSLPSSNSNGSNDTLTSSTWSSTNNSSDFRDPCARLPLTPQLWQSLKLDDYLKNFPGGNDLPLEDYAAKVGATNFVCGIGKSCNANQICLPVRGRDWYILVATQNWNSFTNDMYQATAFALELVQGKKPVQAAIRTTNCIYIIICSKVLMNTNSRLNTYRYTLFPLTFFYLIGLATSIVNDIAPHELDRLMVISTLVGVFAGLCGAIPGFLFPSALSVVGGTIWPFVQGDTGLFSGLLWTYHNIYARLPSDEFSKTMDVNYLLSKAQSEYQAKISNSSKTVLQKGISSDEGLYGVLKGGIFLDNHFSASERSEDELQDAISSVARARLIAAIWKATKYFVVRGNTSCTEDGPNGALPGDNVYSYCNEEGMMMNIVQSKKGKLVDRFPAARLLPAKYHFTTQYFVEQSWQCQEKYGMYCYDPYKNTTLPVNTDAECIISLAVCDMTREDIRNKAKKKGILAACREVGKLPGI